MIISLRNIYGNQLPTRTTTRTPRKTRKKLQRMCMNTIDVKVTCGKLINALMIFVHIYFTFNQLLIQGVFFNWCPPKNHKFFSVSKF